MGKQKYKCFVGDFETTVFEGQEHTEVWASAVVEMFTEDVKILHSIDETFKYFISLNHSILVYYHNLKFDGAFWLDYLLKRKDLKQAVEIHSNNQYDVDFLNNKDMPNKSFKYNISDMGQWYSIIIKYNNKYIELRDSLKLLPFSVKRIGNSFDTKHKKLDMEYKGYRYAGCEITEEEQKYIKNDVLVIKEALEIMYNEGHNKITIGSCCLAEFKKQYDRYEYEGLFPNIYDIEIDEKLYGSPNAGEYIRKSYKGGWCYVVKGKENQIKTNGTTADVNSLYPSMMSSESGNYYPVGTPTFWKGNYIPIEALNRYYFIRVKCSFYIKKNKLPFIQIKNNIFYKGTEMLETSDIFDEEQGIYCNSLIVNGKVEKIEPILTLTMTDFKLMKEHYNFDSFEILDGCYFFKQIGLFDRYINKYRKIKMESKGAKRELAKLFLNNLYGKMATSKRSSFKYAFLNNENAVSFITVIRYDKNPGYIPIGSAITSYARNFTIRAAQNNYYGVNKKGFIYADTDSIHCDLLPNEIIGIEVHPKNFCCWKLESCWDVGIFARQKTYIEHIVAEDEKPIEKPYYNVKCAGMPDKCKNLFIESITQNHPNDLTDYTEEEIEFVMQRRTLEDFKQGLKITGKLMPKRINGGILLVDTTYEMR